MRKILIITLVDGTVIEKDLTNAKTLDGRIIPIGTQANSPIYVDQCALLTVSGIIVEERADYVKYAGPGMIKTVEVKFEK